MNIKITDIAEHCDFYIGNEHYDKSHEEKQRLFMEKFAELIIRECCNKIERKYKYALGEKTQWAMSQDVQDLLKEHFGVEE